MDEVYIVSSETEQDSSSAELEMDPEDIVPKDNATLAEEKKTLGNEQYKARNYQTALRHYSEAISFCPENASYYRNRSACYMMLTNYKLALDDARISIVYDPTFDKSYVRAAKCCILLGDIIGAEQLIKKLQEIDPNNSAIKAEQENCQQLRSLEQRIQADYEKKSFRTVVYLIDQALKTATACARYRLLKSECLAYLNRVDEASDIALNIMKTDSTSVDAIYVRGLCLYFSDNLDKGILHFERALQLDPDCLKAKQMRIKAKALKEKKESGNDLFKTGKFREAAVVYTEALEVDPFNLNMNSKLYYNRALVYSRIGNLRDSIEDCTKVLDINSQYLKALLLRARCHNDLEKFEECVADYEAALQLQKTQEIKNLLREAKFNLKKSKRRNYYKILGVTQGATEDEIKKAYKKKALLHHPDRHANLPDSEKKEQELKFKEIGEAYAVLTDPRKKMRYDNGQDMEDDHSDMDMRSQMFEQFFRAGGGGGGTSFGFQF